MERRYRTTRLLLVAFMAVGVAPTRATPPSEQGGALKATTTSRVKVGTGVITDVVLARNPDRGDLLVVYDAEGRIYGTVLKEREGNRFKGRKARLISSRRRIHHRPSALWNPERGLWTVAWDTGPADLDVAVQEHVAGISPLESSDIRIRELRARNGKPRGPERVIDDGTLNLSPQLFLAAGGGGAAPEPEHERTNLLRSTAPLPSDMDFSTEVEVTDPEPDGIIGTGDDDGTTSTVTPPPGAEGVRTYDQLLPFNTAAFVPSISFDGSGASSTGFTLQFNNPDVVFMRLVETTPGDSWWRVEVVVSWCSGPRSGTRSARSSGSGP